METISYDIKNQVEEMLNRLVKQLTEKDSLIQNKDQEIVKLNEALKQAHQEIEELRASYSEKTEECTLPIHESQHPKDEEELRLLIIYEPREVFSYSRNIIRWYFNELDFSKLAFKDIIHSVKGLVHLADCEMVDELLYHISDHRLGTITKGEMEEVLTLISSYLCVQNEKEVFSADGIYYFLEKLYEKNWCPLVKDFIKTNQRKLEDLLFQIDETRYKNQYPLVLLKIYFELQLHLEMELWLDKIISSIGIPEAIETNEAMELLYMSLVYGQEEVALSNLTRLRETIPSSTTPEVLAFNIYRTAITDNKITKEVVDKLSVLQTASKKLHHNIKSRGFLVMINRLDQILDEQRKMIQEENRKFRAETPTPKPNSHQSQAKTSSSNNTGKKKNKNPNKPQQMAIFTNGQKSQPKGVIAQCVTCVKYGTESCPGPSQARGSYDRPSYYCGSFRSKYRNEELY